jgi:hypothetical protein
MQRTINGKVYFKLLELARRCELITYGMVADIAGVPVRSSTLWTILDDINLHELGEQRPMLSAIVIAQESGIPGEGFFTQAKALGRQGASEGDTVFWKRECDRVYAEFAS